MIGIKPLHPYEARILQVLSFALRPLTTNQVAQFSGISFNTVAVYLNRMNRSRQVKKARDGNRTYWYL